MFGYTITILKQNGFFWPEIRPDGCSDVFLYEMLPDEVVDMGFEIAAKKTEECGSCSASR